jgi:phosphotransferase system enzyme I (PtsI)
VKFEGIAASPGIGVGPLLCYEPEEFAITDAPVAPGEVESEIASFRRALASARTDLSKLRDGIAAELGDDEASIYDAHLLMVDDPELKKGVEGAIRGERCNAAYAFRRYMSGVAAQFVRVEDEYLRERRADIIDVERRVLLHLLNEPGSTLADLEQPSVVVAHDIGPSQVAFLKPEKVLGIVTEVGGRTSHSAIVARGRGIPAVLSVGGVLKHAVAGRIGAVDGYTGTVEIDPDRKTAEAYRNRQSLLEQESQVLGRLRDEPAVTLDGHKVEIGANIEQPSDVPRVIESGADGIGLFRTEFFYLGRYELPSEDEQYRAYREVAERLSPRPVIFRTMDLGGDKVASYLGTTHETNPFLGWRGIRFALHHPEVFRSQLAAILRASAHGRVRMMFPMISNLDELMRTLELCKEVREELAGRDAPYDAELEVGIMVETPSAVWIADVLAEHASFLSIGTNDLVQYTLAIDRGNERLAQLYEPLEPAVLRSIRHTVDAGHRHGRWVGICGEMAGDPRTAVLLLGLGVDEMSVSCFDLPRVKAAVRSVRREDAKSIAEEALRQPSAKHVKALLRERVDTLLPSFLVVKRSPV